MKIILLVVLLFVFCQCQTRLDVSCDIPDHQTKVFSLDENSAVVHFDISTTSNGVFVEIQEIDRGIWRIVEQHLLKKFLIGKYELKIDKLYRIVLNSTKESSSVKGNVIFSPKTSFEIIYKEYPTIEKNSSLDFRLYQDLQYVVIIVNCDTEVDFHLFDNSKEVGNGKCTPSIFLDYLHAIDPSTYEKSLLSFKIINSQGKDVNLILEYMLFFSITNEEKDGVHNLNLHLPPGGKFRYPLPKRLSCEFWEFSFAALTDSEIRIYKKNEPSPIFKFGEKCLNIYHMLKLDPKTEYDLEVATVSQPPSITNVYGTSFGKEKSEDFTFRIDITKEILPGKQGMVSYTWMRYLFYDWDKVTWKLDCSDDIKLEVVKILDGIKCETVFSETAGKSEVKSFQKPTNITEGNRFRFQLVNDSEDDITIGGSLDLFMKIE